jgi:hypothetical protein
LAYLVAGLQPAGKAAQMAVSGGVFFSVAQDDEVAVAVLLTDEFDDAV